MNRIFRAAATALILALAACAISGPTGAANGNASLVLVAGATGGTGGGGVNGDVNQLGVNGGANLIGGAAAGVTFMGGNGGGSAFFGGGGIGMPGILKPACTSIFTHSQPRLTLI